MSVPSVTPPEADTRAPASGSFESTGGEREFIREFFASLSMSERIRLYDFFTQEVMRQCPERDWSRRSSGNLIAPSDAVMDAWSRAEVKPIDFYDTTSNGR